VRTNRYLAVKPLPASLIKQLSTRKGVRGIAVENFLGTLHVNDSKNDALLNLEQDSRLYRWKPETVQAIRAGIDAAEESVDVVENSVPFSLIGKNLSSDDDIAVVLKSERIGPYGYPPGGLESSAVVKDMIYVPEDKDFIGAFSDGRSVPSRFIEFALQSGFTEQDVADMYAGKREIPLKVPARVVFDEEFDPKNYAGFPRTGTDRYKLWSAKDVEKYSELENSEE
jgi:hypothetical protein